MMQDDVLQGEPVLAEIVRRLVQALKPERIYLFGSKARGDTGADSAYDLMVVVTHSSEPAYRRAKYAYEVLRGIPTAAEVLVSQLPYWQLCA